MTLDSLLWTVWLAAPWAVAISAPERISYAGTAHRHHRKKEQQ